MDNNEVDEDDSIDKLLDALDGIEQCFALDFDEEEREPIDPARKPRKSYEELRIGSSAIKFESERNSCAPVINSRPPNVEPVISRKSFAATASFDNSDKALHQPVEKAARPSKFRKVGSHETSENMETNRELYRGKLTNFPRERGPALQDSAILETVKKSARKEVSKLRSEKLMVLQKLEKPLTQVTKCTPTEGLSSHSREFAIPKKLPKTNASPNTLKETNIKTIPFRKPEKITGLPSKRPAELPKSIDSRNVLSDVDLFAPLGNLNVKRKTPNLSCKRLVNVGKSTETIDLTDEKSDSEKVSNLPLKKPVALQNLLEPSKLKPNSPSTTDQNSERIPNLLDKSLMVPKKLTNVHMPFSKEPTGDSNAKKDLNLIKRRTVPSSAQNSAQEIRNNVDESFADEITKKQKVIYGGDSPLPTEILIKIFKYLSVSERKSAKLVCKCWYDTCSIKIFMLRQRFVCCGNYSTISILQTLTKIRCEYLNLEFYRVNFCDNFNEYWKQIGPKIHALYFVDCVLGEETFGDVIINCTEMQCFSISFEYLKIPSIKIFSLTLFENLYKQRIERKKVVSFDLQINSNGWFSNAILSNLFAIFPNVSRLGFTCHSLNPVADGVEAVAPCDIDFSDLWSSKALTFSPILKRIVNPPDSLEKLALDLHTKGLRTGFAWQSVVTHAKLTRLREIVIEVDLRKMAGNAVIEFCCNQKELKSVNCKIVGSAKLFISLFLLKLIDSCPRLRNLAVAYNSSFLISNELFRGLVNSKLRSLRIESTSVLLAPQITDELTWPTNEHLRSLSLSDGVGKDLKNLLIVIFNKLTFLEIHNLSDDILQLIWKFQTNLVTLKLCGVEECTIDGFCGVPENTSFSIRNLQELEYLVIEAVNDEWQVYGNVFSEFQFPKLRYFCVDIEGSQTLYGDLLDAIVNFSELEALSITCSGVERSSWLKLDKGWKKLRYLRVVDKQCDRFKMKQYCNFFKASPSLRALVHEFKSSTESYYYDVLDKMVKRKIYRAKYRINSEKVGNCFIDWLWF